MWGVMEWMPFSKRCREAGLHLRKYLRTVLGKEESGKETGGKESGQGVTLEAVESVL